MSDREQMLQRFYERQAELIQQLRALRNAIVGFGGEISSRELEDLLDIEDEAKADRQRKLLVPEKFDPTLPIIYKIAYVMRHQMNSQGYASEIAEKLRILENAPETQRDAYKKKVTIMCSYLYRDGRLKVKQEGGNRYLYILID